MASLINDSIGHVLGFAVPTKGSKFELMDFFVELDGEIGTSRSSLQPINTHSADLLLFLLQDEAL